jgi:histidinol dehydrogenase
MNVYVNPLRQEWEDLLKRPGFSVNELYGKVQSVLDEIRLTGDAAVAKYTKMFDGVALSSLQVSREEIERSGDELTQDLKDAIVRAAKNIQMFHAAQKTETKKIDIQPGVLCWQKSVPIERVGLYIPGGTAPLFSTVMMLAIPARIAGCEKIVLCTPPNKEGKVHPAILFAASVVGDVDVYKAGGVQAIGAMAYGTETIPKTYKIFGPGNQYVTAAKQIVSRHDVAIDMPAGPSEVAVMADDSADPEFVAADLLSQAEHGADSQVILVSTSHIFVDKVNKAITKQLDKLPRREMALQSLYHSKAFVMKDTAEMTELINCYAPEHLIISLQDADAVAEKVVNAGSVFIGNYTPESVGDYASGTNHTLPTNGWARVYSGVNLDAYVRKITFQKLSEEGISAIGPDVETMARTEGLDAHANAVTVRLQKINKK